MYCLSTNLRLNHLIRKIIVISSCKIWLERGGVIWNSPFQVLHILISLDRKYLLPMCVLEEIRKQLTAELDGKVRPASRAPADDFINIEEFP